MSSTGGGGNGPKFRLPISSTGGGGNGPNLAALRELAAIIAVANTATATLKIFFFCIFVFPVAQKGSDLLGKAAKGPISR